MQIVFSILRRFYIKTTSLASKESDPIHNRLQSKAFPPSNCNFGDEDGWQRVDRRRESVRDGGGSRKKDSFCSGLIFCVRV